MVECFGPCQFKARSFTTVKLVSCPSQTYQKLACGALLRLSQDLHLLTLSKVCVVSFDANGWKLCLLVMYGTLPLYSANENQAKSGPNMQTNECWQLTRTLPLLFCSWAEKYSLKCHLGFLRTAKFRIIEELIYFMHDKLYVNKKVKSLVSKCWIVNFLKSSVSDPDPSKNLNPDPVPDPSYFLRPSEERKNKITS